MEKTKKKILFLGGARQQIPAIQKACEMGYYIITCDYLPNNPGHAYSNEYYNVSTTDKEGVYQLAKQLNVDGIVCYASDPSASSAAYACEKLGLPTNPYEAVCILTNKSRFRKFLTEHNFKTPKARSYTSFDVANKELTEFQLPVMVKPVDSSGSKGISCLWDEKELYEKFQYARFFSRSEEVLLEEYVEKQGYQVAGDGFSINGELRFVCFGNDHFDNMGSFPFVPTAASFPCCHSQQIQQKICEEIQRLFYLLGLKNGAYNFDIRIDAQENVYLMEVGPRNGGNYIPQLVQYETGVDLIEYTIKAAVGDNIDDLMQHDNRGYYSYYALHSNSEGILKEILVHDKIKPNIQNQFMYYKEGDLVPAYSGSHGTIGIFLLKFDSMEEMLYNMDNPQSWIQIILEE